MGAEGTRCLAMDGGAIEFRTALCVAPAGHRNPVPEITSGAFREQARQIYLFAVTRP